VGVVGEGGNNSVEVVGERSPSERVGRSTASSCSSGSASSAPIFRVATAEGGEALTERAWAAVSRVELERKSGKSSVTLYFLGTELDRARDVIVCEDEMDEPARCRDEDATEEPSRVACNEADEGGTVTTFIAGIVSVFVLETDTSDGAPRVCPRRKPNSLAPPPATLEPDDPESELAEMLALDPGVNELVEAVGDGGPP
jgi:hypothetical protein